MNDIDDLKAVVDQLLIEKACLTTKVDALSVLLKCVIDESIPQPAARALLRDHYKRYESAINHAFDQLVDSGILFGNFSAAKLKFEIFDEVQAMRKKYGLDGGDL